MYVWLGSDSAIGKFGATRITDMAATTRETFRFDICRSDVRTGSDFQSNVPTNRLSFSRFQHGGVAEGDFTMVFGYPGTTNEYLTSYAIDQIASVEDLHKIKIRQRNLM